MTFAELAAALGSANAYGALVAATPAIAAEIQDKLAPYPPSGPGNRPRPWRSGGPNSWYVRGTGSFWVVKSGAIRSRATSQTLGRRWSITRLPNGALLKNTASYADAVLGAGQTATFKAIGWPNARTAVETVIHSGAVGRIISQALAHAFSQAGGH